MMRHTWLMVVAVVPAVRRPWPRSPTTRYAADRTHHRRRPAQQRGHPRGAGDRGAVRARPVQHPAADQGADGGPPAAATAIDKGQADLAVVRRDTGMPKNGQAVAILRKNVVVFIVPSAAEPPNPRNCQGQDRSKCEGQGRSQGQGAPRRRRSRTRSRRSSRSVGQRLGVIGRSPRNIELLKVILRQYRIGARPDRDAVHRRSRASRTRPARSA